MAFASPAHYGDPYGEQRAWLDGRAAADLTGLAVIRVTGPDRLTWLNSLLSQRLSDLAPGGGVEALLLDVAGRVEQAVALTDDGAAAWLVTLPGQGPSLAAFLESMRFRRRVTVTDATAETAVLAVPGGAPAAPAEASAGLWHWDDPWPGVCPGGSRYAVGAGHPGAAWRLRLIGLPRPESETAWTRLVEAGVRPVGTWALEALRIAAWRPLLGVGTGTGTEATDRLLPAEVDWLRSAVHLDKGCYRGQEAVAKIHNLGRPPRRLVMLHLDGSADALPRAGQPLLLRDGGPAAGAVGAVTAAARHHELGPIGLGLVKRTTDPAADFLAGGIAAAQEVIVPVHGEAATRPVIDRPRRGPGGLGAPARRLGLGRPS
jgi:folate-binding protein YgfZ